MNKKIVISTYTFLPDIGGVATNKSTLAKALSEMGHDVLVVTNTESSTPDKEKAYKIKRKPSLVELVRIYYDADIVLLSNTSLRLGWPALFVKSNYGLHHHSSSAFNKKIDNTLIGFIKNLVEKNIIKKSIHFVNSNFTLRDGEGFFKDLTVEVTYPIASRENIPRKNIDNYLLKKDAFFAGRLEKEKGVSFLIERFDLIKEILGIETLHIAGDGEMRSEVESIAQNEGINYIGSVCLDEIYARMDAAAYVFIPSIWNEPFGNVAVEGVASGAVVISSNRGGLPEAVGKSGILFDIDSKRSFINALQKARHQYEINLSSLVALNEYVNKANLHLSKFSEKVIAKIVLDQFK